MCVCVCVLGREDIRCENSVCVCVQRVKNDVVLAVVYVCVCVCVCVCVLGWRGKVKVREGKAYNECVQAISSHGIFVCVCVCVKLHVR